MSDWTYVYLLVLGVVIAVGMSMLVALFFVTLAAVMKASVWLWQHVWAWVAGT